MKFKVRVSQTLSIWPFDERDKIHIFCYSRPCSGHFKLNNILTKRSRKGLSATAPYILLDVENRKLKICYDGQDGLMMRRDGNILEAGKAGGIPLGVVEKNNYIEENIFSLLPGFLVFLY
jgi:hypothetical protein